MYIQYHLFGLSLWFYLGVLAGIVGIVLIAKNRAQTQSKLLENGYFLLVLAGVGIISEWTDFATVLLCFTLITGLILLFHKLFGSKAGKKPHYVHYSREFFPIVLCVWILRAFLFEAYQIPSGSMRPTLTVGDFVLVNKFDYGIREPFTNKVIIPVHKVKRGDIIVFKDPTTPNRDLIKRVVALGGDTLTYTNKKLTINGKALEYTPNGDYNYQEQQGGQTLSFNDQRFTEDLLGVKHSIITWNQVPSVFSTQVLDFKGKAGCTYSSNDSFSCVIPEGEYFMMGDNRDDSFDSRYWGFVPEQAILGRAFYVLINLHDLKRLGISI